MNAARSQEYVRAFEPLRLIFGVRVRAYAGLERELPAWLRHPDSQRGIGKHPARRIDELRRADHVEGRIIVRFSNDPHVRDRFPVGVPARRVRNARAAED
jgi:hypothetical protein